MQSQQKKVKWSRGETADALEERTDTGITQVSVSKMENIIADIYGNISRRPAFRMTQYDSGVVDLTQIAASKQAKMIPFQIQKDDHVIFVFPDSVSSEETQDYPYYRIKNNKIVYVGKITSEIQIILPTGYAQNNNYLIITCDKGVYKIQATEIGDKNIQFSLENFVYSGAWYTENTQQATIDNTTIPGLTFNSNQAGPVYISLPDTVNNIENNMYSAISTGVKFTTNNIELFNTHIPVGSIVMFANMGGQMRIEGYMPFGNDNTYNSGIEWPNIVFDNAVLSLTQAENFQGVCCLAYGVFENLFVEYWANGRRIDRKQFYIGKGTQEKPYIIIQNRSSTTGFSQLVATHGLAAPHCRWENIDPATMNMYAYGELLAPIVDKTQVDTKVTVLSGFTELNSVNSTPRTLTFSNQRLFMGGFFAHQYNVDYVQDFGSVVVGSQIAKYNDFKNNYNAANEAITIDANTLSRERVLHVVSYNGIQIFTDCAEYTYTSDGAIKQSTNGCSDCMPAVYNSSLVYVDRSKKYIRVAQYEFRNNIYNSTKINALAQEDLVWNPVSMALYEEKTHHTGSFLFVINNITDLTVAHSHIAVCNFLPQNQEVIWTRWNTVAYPYEYEVTEQETTTLRFAWYDQRTQTKTFTATNTPEINDQLYKENGDLEDQFYQNTVFGVSENSIEILKDERMQNYYAWTGGGYVGGGWTLSDTPQVDDLLYSYFGDGAHLLSVKFPELTKVWAVSGSQIKIQPDMYFWQATQPDGYYVKRYFTLSATPQVNDIAYGYSADVGVGDHRARFVIKATDGTSITVQRVNDQMETIDIVATRDSTGDQSEVWATRNSALDTEEPVQDIISLPRYQPFDVTYTESVTKTYSGETGIICDTLQIDNKMYFLCGKEGIYRLAELDYEATLDFHAPIIENKYRPSGLLLTNSTVQVYDGNEYKFDAVVGADGTLTPSAEGLEHANAGYWINATLESHPIDIQGKTYTEKKRIGKCVAVIRDTEPGAFTVCDKTGYTAPDKKTVNFYGCTGMKDLVRYTIKNIKGAKFTIESLTMIIEYGTLDS